MNELMNEWIYSGFPVRAVPVNGGLRQPTQLLLQLQLQLQPHFFLFSSSSSFASSLFLARLRLSFILCLTLSVSIRLIILFDRCFLSRHGPQQSTLKRPARAEVTTCISSSSLQLHLMNCSNIWFRAGKKEKKPPTRAPKILRLSHCTTASPSSTSLWTSACTSTSSLVYGGLAWPRSMMANRPDTSAMTLHAISRASPTLVWIVSCPPLGPADTLRSQLRSFGFPVRCVRKWRRCLQAGISLALC